MLKGALAIALIALIASACCSSRQTAVSEFQGSKVLCEQSEQARAQEFKDSVKVEKVVVEVHDTVMETTTIVVDRNEAGDTVRLSTVTERDRVRDRAQVKDQHERVVTKHDTVYIATRDSSYVQNTNLAFPSAADRWFTNGTNGRATPVVLTLKWVFWIIIAVIALIVTIKLSRIIRI
jgi:hypothetical protein